MRVDKFLWAIRVFKTRSMASQHCREGKVSVADKAVKPAREMKVGEVVEVRKGRRQLTPAGTRVLGLATPATSPRARASQLNRVSPLSRVSPPSRIRRRPAMRVIRMSRKAPGGRGTTVHRWIVSISPRRAVSPIRTAGGASVCRPGEMAVILGRCVACRLAHATSRCSSAVAETT